MPDFQQKPDFLLFDPVRKPEEKGMKRDFSVPVKWYWQKTLKLFHFIKGKSKKKRA